MHDPAAIAGSMFIGFSLILILIFGGVLAAVFCFLLTLHNLLEEMSRGHRAMEPGLVWLNLLPFFNLFWMAWTVLKIAESLNAALAHKQLTNLDNGCKNLGLAMVGCFIASFIPFIGWVSSVVGLILWILYWRKLATYRKLLSAD